ncbi:MULTISPECIES: GNAT family N-acetyltransferase [Enterococcus]|uniref:N-acetyltransferase domain-containing protein n=1 Tax=Enterococcus sulfureus ATCC 49903 TaxID=1140003 RepID=S0LDK5_9ENTE|nr:GNAT family N-acetyltransferase [Enterococcus sulfureus]EOT51395.1 hypothetical protein OMY_00108 [Enterococcus sulfureus ATCC 49903]EOT87052.1 hypothetical protein I573_00107 [Enterococcus sulfureus ATCC 49903]
MDIRVVTQQDIPAILAIYSHYVRETATTFEYEIPTLSEFSKRVHEITARYPYIVACEQDRVVGYAYASTYKARAAYDWSAEVSVYLAPEAIGKKIGRALYEELEHALRTQQVHQVLACITSANCSSISFHEKMGYHVVGQFQQVGYKFDQWWDITWMQKQLLTSERPADFCPFGSGGESK